mmetsp:Transcript_40859/g.102723  ORF Transcript_40859/g.102723 Transcript_40859/m.102723 type:complete len:352 (+) Transcript_40859:204-1259(+)
MWARAVPALIPMLGHRDGLESRSRKLNRLFGGAIVSAASAPKLHHLHAAARLGAGARVRIRIFPAQRLVLEAVVTAGRHRHDICHHVRLNSRVHLVVGKQAALSADKVGQAADAAQEEHTAHCGHGDGPHREEELAAREVVGLHAAGARPSNVLLLVHYHRVGLVGDTSSEPRQAHDDLRAVAKLVAQKLPLRHVLVQQQPHAEAQRQVEGGDVDLAGRHAFLYIRPDVLIAIDKYHSKRAGVLQVFHDVAPRQQAAALGDRAAELEHVLPVHVLHVDAVVVDHDLTEHCHLPGEQLRRLLPAPLGAVACQARLLRIADVQSLRHDDRRVHVGVVARVEVGLPHAHRPVVR